MPADDPAVWLKRLTVEADVLTWLTVHGFLSLALRHPKVEGPSKELAAVFLRSLSYLLVQYGACTAQEMAFMMRAEGLDGTEPEEIRGE